MISDEPRSCPLSKVQVNARDNKSIQADYEQSHIILTILDKDTGKEMSADFDKGQIWSFIKGLETMF